MKQYNLKIFQMGGFNHQVDQKSFQRKSLTKETPPGKVLRASWSTPCSKAPISPPGKVSSGRRRRLGWEDAREVKKGHGNATWGNFKEENHGGKV